ncbi:PR domain zinc finger protein 8b isoform X1 [Latimeria chalumnae]|uniref:PR domain zinc finger protein 8 n=2 Tax=Latimeria chalumnae TaxID=7897 RepID=H2ZXG5_LATCH|nr:PREDICTED: PR domain zinc finger protein 8 isoform X2 [Latimeria chalumnae]XP_014348054.1 PREDICTED: PR domain zinc finger protein 8 isoform X2 [Latimeria chalumnae]|eukprot:XP_006002810.1 PREDICTED: PR domain zinc finger protein 8 isoform X2 [Latimeria chalumnae]
MEDWSAHKGIWDGDAKTVQQCLTDIFTSVYTTCDIPENAIFGPCVLSHTSLYDSIAFIALKSAEKRTVPYIFRVDTSVANGSSEGLMWLRLVQSARDTEEQNLEAYVKNGQLFYRSLRRIAKDEELLVWYGKELTELLLLSRSQSKTNGSSPYSCVECSQRFQFEFPFLAHLRFRCPKRLQGSNTSNENGKDSNSSDQMNTVGSSTKYGRSEGQPAYSSPQDGKPSTDFHNLARDVENARVTHRNSQDSEIVSENNNKRKYDELEKSKNGSAQHASKFVDTSPGSPKGDLVCTPQHFRGNYFSIQGNGRLFTPSNTETTETKRSAFTEVKKGSQCLRASSPNPEPNVNEGKDSVAPSVSPSEKLISTRPSVSESQVQARLDNTSVASAFTTVSQLCGTEERKSAFSQPTRSFSQLSPLVMTQKLVPGIECHSTVGDTITPSRLYQTDPLAVKLQSSDLNGNCTIPGGIPKQSPFLYATTFWPKTSGPLQLQVPSALTLLPPSFTSLCLPAQNWCAKCNASFRMTSDLVYHMRSHHKKEYAMEPLVKRRREEKLKCPICNESFRERHHLSRHMTSHN